MATRVRRGLRARLVQFLVVSWLGKTSKPRYSSILRAEFADGDKLSEARLLQQAGYREAAIATSRAGSSD